MPNRCRPEIPSIARIRRTTSTVNSSPGSLGVLTRRLQQVEGSPWHVDTEEPVQEPGVLEHSATGRGRRSRWRVRRRPWAGRDRPIPRADPRRRRSASTPRRRRHRASPRASRDRRSRQAARRRRRSGSAADPRSPRPLPSCPRRGSAARARRPRSGPRSNTAFASGWSPTSIGSPPRTSRFRAPSAQPPSRSAVIARRLRSRQTSWSVGSAPASWTKRAPASGDMCGDAEGLSVTLTAST